MRSRRPTIWNSSRPSDPDHAGDDADGLPGHGVAWTHSLDARRPRSPSTSRIRSAVKANVRWCLEHGVHAVVGTTGMTAEDIDELRMLADGADANCVIAPNFALGAVLLLRFAAEAARFFDAAEVIELHHDGKVDAPSGTALATARAIDQARAGDWSAPDAIGADPSSRGADVEGVRVHAVRLPGLVAHEEVLFGGPGQVLTHPPRCA